MRESLSGRLRSIAIERGRRTGLTTALAGAVRQLNENHGQGAVLLVGTANYARQVAADFSIPVEAIDGVDTRGRRRDLVLDSTAFYPLADHAAAIEGALAEARARVAALEEVLRCDPCGGAGARPDEPGMCRICEGSGVYSIPTFRARIIALMERERDLLDAAEKRGGA